MRALLLALAVAVGCSSERPEPGPRTPPADLPETADLGPITDFAPVLRRRCVRLDDPCRPCVDRVSGAYVLVSCDRRVDPPRVDQIIFQGASPSAPLSDGIYMAIAYLEPIMTESREAKLRHMARNVSPDVVPPLSLSYIDRSGYSVDGLYIQLQGWYRFPQPEIMVVALSKDNFSRVEDEWTLGKVPKRNWKRD